MVFSKREDFDRRLLFLLCLHPLLLRLRLRLLRLRLLRLHPRLLRLLRLRILLNL